MLSPNATAASFQHRLAGFAGDCLPNHWADDEQPFPNREAVKESTSALSFVMDQAH
jgi:hypothetical protein